MTYAYDDAGRRTTIGGSYARTGLPPVVSITSHNAANQQTAFGSQTLSYDLNGNLTSDGTNTYIWNGRNQLVSMTGPGLTASFQYDAFGKRISKTVNGNTITYLYDGPNMVQEQSGGSPSANTLTGGLDEVISLTDSGGAWSPLFDGLGITPGLADSTGTVQTQYTYEPFGQTSVSGSASTNASQFTGRENDGTGLYYYRARYYSPKLQRFIANDPIGLRGGINLYAYVGNNPLGFVDPFGTDTIQVGISVTGILARLGYTGGVGVAIDFSGNVGLYYEHGPAYGVAAGVSGGGVFHYSNADTIYGLEGLFTNGSVDAGAGPKLSLDGLVGQDENGQTVVGGGFTFGKGAGGGAYLTETNTTIPFSTNWWERVRRLPCDIYNPEYNWSDCREFQPKVLGGRKQ